MSEIKTAGEIVCDNREFFHPDAKPQAMIDLVRMIQANALRHAAGIHMQHPPSEHHECNKAILEEADRIEEGAE